MSELNKESQDFVEGDILTEDDSGETSTSKVIKKTAAPTAIVLSIIAVAVISVYFVLDYRISKSDKRTVELMETLRGNLDTKTLADTIKEGIATALKEVDTKIDVISKRVNALEQEIVVLKNKNADLNVTELMLLKDSLEVKLANINQVNPKTEKVQTTKEVKPETPKQPTAKPVSGTSMSLVTPPTEAPKIAQQSEEGNPATVTEAVEPNHVVVDKKVTADEITLPFEVVKIVKANVVNIKIGGKIYSISIDDELILGRYEIRVVDTANGVVFVYDTKLKSYFQQKVTGGN